MGALIVITVVLAAMVLFDYLALTRGVDSRPVSDTFVSRGGILPA